LVAVSEQRCKSVKERKEKGWRGMISWFFKQVMTNPPLLSIPKSEGLSTGEKEDTPTVKGSVGLSHGQILVE
jgi:hypothetical protein